MYTYKVDLAFNNLQRLIYNKIQANQTNHICLFVYLFGVYGISTIVGYLMPNPFFTQFQTIHFSISTQFNCQNHFYSKLFSLVKQF